MSVPFFMLRYAIVILFSLVCCAPVAHAQGGRIIFTPTTEKVFANDAAQIGTFEVYRNFGDCQIYIDGPIKPSRFSYDVRTGIVSARLPAPGIYYDTARFHIAFSSKCGITGDYDLETYVEVLSDSVVLIRPATAVLNVTAVDTGWYGVNWQRLINNVDDTTQFTNWRLQIDTSLHAKLQVLDDQTPVTSIFAAPFDTVKADLAVRVFHGPIYLDTVLKGTLLVDVRNTSTDTTYAIPITLNIAKAPWEPHFSFSTDSVKLTAIAGDTASATLSLTIDPATLTQSLRPLHGTISRDDITLVPGGPNEIVIRGSALTKGRYFERLKYECTLPDHNGEPRKADKSVRIELNVTGDQGKTIWEGTAADMLDPTHVELTADGTIYAAVDKKIFRSYDRGEHWTIFPTDAASYGFAIDDHGRMVSQNDWVRYTTDDGVTWHDAPLGFKYGSGTQERFARYHVENLFSLDSEIHGYGFAVWAYEGETQPRTTQGGGFTIDGGATWQNEILYDGNPTIMVRDSAGHKVTAIRTRVIAGPGQRATYFAGLVRHLCVSASGRIYAVTDDGVYSSTNEGDSWIRHSLLFPGVSGFGATPDGQLYLTTNGYGVYHSSDGGDHWNSLNGGLGAMQVRSMAMRPGYPIYLATNGGGVYRAKEAVALPAKNIINRSESRAALALRASDEITLDLDPASTSFSIRLMNALGQQVSIIQVDAEVRTCTIDLRTLANGVYFLESPHTLPLTKLLIQH